MSCLLSFDLYIFCIWIKVIASASLGPSLLNTMDHPCQVCDKTFPTFNQLKVHILVHSWEKHFKEHPTNTVKHLFPFTSCDMSFSISSYLKTLQVPMLSRLLILAANV